MKLLSLLKNDLLLLLRDRPHLVELFLLPLAFILPVSFALGKGDGYGVTAGNRKERLPVVNFDQGERAEEMIRLLNESFFIERNFSGEMVKNYNFTDLTACNQVSVACDHAVVQRMLERSWRNTALLIPEGFSSSLDAGQETTVTVLYNPVADVAGREMVAGVIRGVGVRLTLEQIIEKGWGQMSDLSSFTPPDVKKSIDEQSSQPADSNQKPAFSLKTIRPQNYTRLDTPDTYQQTVPGYTVMFVFFIISYLSAVIRDEKRNGTYRRLLTMPVKRAWLLGGKLLGALVIGLAQVAIMFAIGALVFGLDLGSDWIGLVLLTVSLVAAAASMGLATSTIKGAQGVMTAPLIISALVGGCMFPVDIMPAFLRNISYIVPHRWALLGYQNLLVRGQGVLDILPQVGVLLAFAAVFFAIAIWRFDYEES